LVDGVLLGEQVRGVLMGCSKFLSSSGNAAEVFSGKRDDGRPLAEGHRHAHYLSEATRNERAISHLTIFAPMGFSPDDERALERFTEHDDSDENQSRRRKWNGHVLRFVLLGIGQPADFGGLDERAGRSPILATARSWVSRTPFVPARHLKVRRSAMRDPAQRDDELEQALIAAVRYELAHRLEFRDLAEKVVIEPRLSRDECGTVLGGRFTSWLEFRRERETGDGSQAGQRGYGFRLTFPEPVTGPIALGYGCHYGLGLFVPAEDRAAEKVSGKRPD
jgi:CRISPR-associated protein Csb2